ncbi:MAG: polysaccharide biosynthesis C-terminal domain-containing protein [Clostridia bacterium]|nr:polysaccharide biosynthesis C-terminal domain-containing protein [Clostridia bacterium]
MLKKGNVDMLSGSIFKGLISLAIPIMIMNVMQNMFNIIDMTILGRFTNDTAVGAVGTCSTLISLCTGLFIGVSTGANVVVAKCIGCGDKEKTEKTIGTAVLFSVAGGGILLIIGVSLAEVFLKLINCPEALIDKAVLYFRLYFLGAPMLLLYNFCASILRAGGNTKQPLYFLFIGGAIKAILNYFCITALNTTVAGVGIATIVSNTVMSGLAFWALLRNEHKTKFEWSRFRLYASELNQCYILVFRQACRRHYIR